MMHHGQRGQVLEHLRTHGSITALEAQQAYGIMRLASRVNELRSDGVPIERSIEHGRNRFGEYTRYARYRLAAITGDQPGERH